ncbi:MAG: adenylate/guanylate cyclase domain-containing protein [Crocinitomicaceae bacterium]|nr:adenylate/guanylate cyclase domain-containing protein [Crocinitomicaceae bacterium]
MSKPIILCVDDEKIILHGLKSQLKKAFRDECEIEISESGGEALEIIEEAIKDGIDIPVIISDQLMPGMKGNELLRKVHHISPYTVSILLTGLADAASVGDAVNHANLYRYISKPWDGTDLILTVQEAHLKYNQTKLLKTHSDNLEQTVKDRTYDLQREREKSDSLLLNILPEVTAKELKENGSSEPKHFDNVSILFTDFKDFTRISEKMSPKELVKNLNECFSAFDEIVDRHNMEKIKTIGDAYMCAGGLPEENTTNAIDAVYSAWEIRDWVTKWNESKVAQGQEPWEIRIGVHTGELVAGVIGINKFAYDVWGDAVNVASRLETNSEVGMINISSVTHDQIKTDFECTYRGEIEAKNRGAIKMYFVDSLK